MKECFKCKQILELSEFYKHPMMGDGHLNKCKKCTRKDSEDRRKIKEKDINWFLSERERHREKSKKYRELGKSKPKRYSEKWLLENPEKKKAYMAIKNALRSGKMHRHPCCICGNKAHAHHEDYSKPLDVIWLCPKHHGERHVQINKEKLLKTL
jgi:hypothetical protein